MSPEWESLQLLEEHMRQPLLKLHCKTKNQNHKNRSRGALGKQTAASNH